MLTRFTRFAFRHFRRDRLGATLNVLGLAVGLGGALLMFSFVRAERGYDRFHPNADRVFRVTYEEVDTPAMRHLATVSPPVGPALAAEYPGVEAFVRLRDGHRHLVAYEDHRFYEDDFFYADSAFFEVFGFTLAAGDPHTALAAPDAVVLTAEAARRYFGEADPLGEVLTFDRDRRYTVTGVLAPAPGRSHLDFDFLVSFASFRVPRGYPVTLESWSWVSFHTYVLLHPDADAAAFEARLPDFMARHFTPERARTARLRLQPVTDIYLGEPGHTHIASGNPAYVQGLFAVGVLLLLLACFNFTNLSTAQSLRRYREVGIRKVLGAQRGDLVRRYLGESVLVALTGLGLAFVLVLAGQAAGRWLGGAAVVPAVDLALVPVFVGLAVAAGLAGGAYPALLLARLAPERVLKGGFRNRASGTRLRSTLVVLQFAIAIGLVAGSLVVTRQMQFVREKALGFDREQVVALHMQGDDLQARYPAIRERLLRNPHVARVTKSGHLLDGDQGSVPVFPEGGEDQDVRAMNIYGVHFGFAETLGIRVAAGRAHAEAFPADSARGILLNQAAARYFAATTPDWDDPVGKALRVSDLIEGRVIGVVEDFHFASLHQPIEPLVLFFARSAVDHVLVRLRPGPADRLLASLQRDWAAVAPDAPFSYTFLDDRVAQLYREDRRFYHLVVAFSLLAVVVACLGLYGLVAFVVQVRTREVGIRKVLGASVPGLVMLLSKPFLRNVAVAGLLAVPTASLALDAWLQGFAYRIEVGAAIPMLACALALAVALLTLGHHTLRAALSNPVRVLRSE